MGERPSRSGEDALASAFQGGRRIAAGSLLSVALAVKGAETASQEPILIFDDETGAVIDLDLRGGREEITERLLQQSPLGRSDPGSSSMPLPEEAGTGLQRARGRPKLGVVAKEVTLLPRHWDWLSSQSGGASASLRRLVDDARRSGEDGGTRRRLAQAAAYRFMAAVGGDWPGFEEAARALFADDQQSFKERLAGWPKDAEAYAVRLGFADG